MIKIKYKTNTVVNHPYNFYCHILCNYQRTNTLLEETSLLHDIMSMGIIMYNMIIEDEFDAHEFIECDACSEVDMIKQDNFNGSLLAI